jgi:hypothetical protein
MLTLAGQKNSRSSFSTKKSSTIIGANETTPSRNRSSSVYTLEGRTTPASSTSTTFNPLKVSDRETETQKKVLKKLKDLQSKRAEMVKERQKVRNYSRTN